MAADLIRAAWKSATDWLLAITLILGFWLARGLVLAPVAIPMATPLVATAEGPGDAPAPAPAPAPAVDGSRVVEVAGLGFAFAGLLARLWLKDRELKRQHADALTIALREIADLKRDAAELASMVATLRAACPNKETCPVRVLDRTFPSLSRPSAVQPRPNLDIDT